MPAAPRPPYYAQTAEFSCGPACALMALSAFGKTERLSRALEFEVWRECNMIGTRGADPWGLALPLARRGLGPRVLAEGRGIFGDRLIAKRFGKDMALLAEWSEKQSRATARRLGVSTEWRAPVLADLRSALEAGKLPITLVYAHQAPHWVLPIRMDDATLTYHDPYRSTGGPRLRVPHKRFQQLMDRLHKYDMKQAAVVVEPAGG